MPLYFAKERPVVERDGMLIMKDDDRMELRPGERIENRMVRFRTLGCYPLTAQSNRTPRSREHRRRDAGVEDLRASGPHDRQGRSRLDGEEEARGLFLIMLDRASEVATVDTVADYVATQEQKSLLRFLTCGSVDDGKSTLIGRLLSDTRQIFEDQMAALERDSKKHGTTGDDVDFALLVDGLEAEREQGITIDVAYRFFSTPRRKFIVADTPGHEQYTRNMATGASTADVAIVLIDARQGVLKQTRRHSIIASLLGIRQIVLAVNKIDLVDYDQTVFERIVADYRAFADQLGFAAVVPIPMSARYGDNVTKRSEATGWYRGPTLIEHLETVEVGADFASKPFVSRCSTSTVPISTSAALPAPSRQDISTGAMRSSSPSPAQLARQAHRRSGR